MDLLGNSIQELFIMSKKTFSLKTVLMIAEQAISRIESLHSLNWMHRDIKPENFLVGRHNFANTIYMIDFGLAKRFKNPETKQHLKYIEGKGFTGNQRFCSNNALLGIEQSRRDDLESIGYMLIYLLRGVLPWEGIGDISNNKRRETLILKKVYTSIEELCFLCPPEFPTYMNYVKSLGFTEKPDYSYIKRLFRDLFFKMDFEFDYVFDWKNARGYHIGGPQVKIKKSTSNSLFTDTTSEEESTFKELNEESKEKDDSCIII